MSSGDLLRCFALTPCWNRCKLNCNNFILNGIRCALGFRRRLRVVYGKTFVLPTSQSEKAIAPFLLLRRTLQVLIPPRTHKQKLNEPKPFGWARLIWKGSTNSNPFEFLTYVFELLHKSRRKPCISLRGMTGYALIASIPQELDIIKTKFCISSLRKSFDTRYAWWYTVLTDWWDTTIATLSLMICHCFRNG